MSGTTPGKISPGEAERSQALEPEESAKTGDAPGQRGFRILLNFVSLSGGKLFGDVATVVLFVLLSRLFGQEGIGIYSFAIGLTGFFAVASELGTNQFSIREFAASEEPFPSLLGRVLSLRIALVAVVTVLLLAVLPLLPYGGETLIVILLIGGYQIAYQTLMGFAAVFLAKERPLAAGLLEGTFKAATAGVAVALALAGAGFTVTLSALPAVGLPVVVAAYLLVRRVYARPEFAWSPRQLFRTARQVLPYGLYVMFVQAQQRLDVTLLGLMIGAVVTGIYNVAYRVVFTLSFVPAFLATAILPVASNLAGSQPEPLRRLYQRALSLGVLIGLPAAVGLALVAEDLILLVFGTEFRDSVLLLQVLAALYFLAFPRVLLGVFLTALGEQAERTRSHGWALLLAALAFPILIRAFGAMGAAAAVLVVETFLVASLAWRLRPLLGLPAVGGRLGIAAAGSAGFVILFTALPPQPMFVVVPGAALLYGAVVLAFPQIRAQEAQLARSILRAGSRSVARVR